MVEPVKEDSKQNQKYVLKSGHSYHMLEEKNDASFKVFLDQVLSGRHGLYITRTNPDIIRRETPLKKTPILWLTELTGDNNIHPSKSEELNYAITKFVETATDSVILLEGTGYLSQFSSFQTMHRLVQVLKDLVSTRNAILIVPLNPHGFSETEIASLKNELEELKI
jgi:hypothetical protein